MKEYLLEHWRGELPLSVALMVNGILGYVIVFAALLLFGQLIPGAPGAYVAAAGFLAWAVWVGVGVVRSALKSYIAAGQPVWRRAAGVLAILLVVAAAALIVRDLMRMFS